MALHDDGRRDRGIDDGEIGWRKALRFALTENPVEAMPPSQRRSKKRTQQSLALFGGPKENAV